MDLSEKSFKLFLFIFAVMVVIVMIFSSILRFYNERNYSEQFDNRESVKYEGGKLPQIINQPNENLNVGEEFVFVPRIAPLDSNFNLNLVKSPDWMILQEGIIRGSPNNTGTFEYIIRITSGSYHYDERFYLVVEEESDE